jgi:hypothetical protein
MAYSIDKTKTRITWTGEYAGLPNVRKVIFIKEHGEWIPNRATAKHDRLIEQFLSNQNNINKFFGVTQ